MRRAILSAFVAVLAAGSVTASGWALQGAALPSPKPAARIAADASAWLHDYRLAVDVFHFHHRRTKGACLRGWFGGRGRPRVRESLLSFRPGPLLRESNHGRVSVARGLPDLPARLAVAAGCTGKLEGGLVTAAQDGTHLTVERAYAANRPALALEWSRGRNKDSTLFVSPRTDQPLVAVVGLDGRYATARLYLARARPRLLARFHLPVPGRGRRTER